MEQISDTKHTSGSDIICLEGNGSRPSHSGDGYRAGGAMYTLNSTEVHCVCYAIKDSQRDISSKGVCQCQEKLNDGEA